MYSVLDSTNADNFIRTLVSDDEQDNPTVELQLPFPGALLM